MSAGLPKSGPTTRLGVQGLGSSTAPSSQALLLEKVGARTSTPDSEALASSDDEGDHRHEIHPPAHQHRPARRSSWLNDTSQPVARPRRESFASSMSPTGSHPSTPSGESGPVPWGSHSTASVMGRAHPPSAFSWGSGIWNADRKDPPSRLSEVLPSPTSVVPPGASNTAFFGSDGGLMSLSREQSSNSQIPFAIPLHPTPKTYRSQSYSVGQLDPENSSPTSGMGSSAVHGRSRHPALQHRPSRPSMLSEMANDATMLGKLQEVDDDEDESTTESMHGSFHQAPESKSYEMLARENAILRQQQQQYNANARIRPRASTGAGFSNNGYPLHESVPEESDFAIDELDEGVDLNDAIARRAASRRMSEYGGGSQRSGGKFDPNNLKKALWSSSLGFPASEIPQSRRHSFANMPTRQGSISSIADSVSALEASAHADQQATPIDFSSAYPEMGMYPQAHGGSK